MKSNLSPAIIPFSNWFKLLLFLLFISLNTQAKIKDNIFIEGYIIDFDKLDKNVYIDKSISVEYYTPLGVNERKTANIDKRGKFKLSFFLLHPQDVIIVSGVSYFTSTLASPGDSINMAMRYLKVDQATQNYPNIHYFPDQKNVFVGTGKDQQNSFFGIYMQTGVLDILKPDPSTVIGGIGLLNIKLAQVPGIVEKHFANVDSLTKSWINNYISYSLISKFIWASRENKVTVDYTKINYERSATQSYYFFNVAKAIDTPDDLEDKIRRSTVFNNPYLKLSADELTLFDKIYSGKASPTDSLKGREFEKSFKANTKAVEAVDSIYCVSLNDYYNKHLPPLLADFKNADLVNDYHLSSYFNNVRAKIFQGISPQMQDYLNAEVLISTKLNKNVTYTKSTEVDVIKMLTKKFPGQNLYVDLWATWCGPCRAEFPYYPQVMDKYNGKVTFVFLCGASEESAYTSVLNNLNFKANHFFLNNSQYANYKNAFGITGIPHYLFITKDGKITNNFKRPSAGNELYALIDTEIGK